MLHAHIHPWRCMMLCTFVLNRWLTCLKTAGITLCWMGEMLLWSIRKRLTTFALSLTDNLSQSSPDFNLYKKHIYWPLRDKVVEVNPNFKQCNPTMDRFKFVLFYSLCSFLLLDSLAYHYILEWKTANKEQPKTSNGLSSGAKKWNRPHSFFFFFWLLLPLCCHNFLGEVTH